MEADDPRLRYEGRHIVERDRVDKPLVRMAYPATAIHLASNARRTVLRCSASSATVFLDVSVNGGDFRRLHLTEGIQEIELANGPRRHREFVVLKRTESWQGELTIRGFECDAGELVAARPAPDRKLLFIGDSITCGAASDIRATDPVEGPHNSSGRHSFGWILSRRLNAECHLVSYGGRGALRDWEGRTGPDALNAAAFYELALPDQADAKWDHARFEPDAILICLGANDFNLGLPNRDEFVAAYANVVQLARRDAPEAHVFLLDSPMFGDGDRRRFLGECLDAVVAEFSDGRVERIPVGYHPGRPEDPHPTADQHEAIAVEIEPVIRERLCW